jgi:heme-degrading monooxygenase HmoA
VVTVWASQEALDAYRTSVETPEGVRMFRAAGAEPSLKVFDVEARIDHS